MRKIVEVLRLKHECGLKHRRIARSVGIARSTVCDYLYRAAAAGLGWPLPESMTEAQVERLLFPPVPSIGSVLRPLPEWATVHQELRRKGMTLLLLWQEYKATHPDGLRYSWFCQSYRLWSGKLDLVMRQEHRAGEKLFVDYAGQTVAVTERATGEIRQAQIFVAVLGASNYTYAEATWTQTLPDWIGSHVRAFEYYGGTTDELIPDNLKSGVTYACFYEPYLNTTYEKMAAHYGMAVLPARVRKPRDRAKVEAGVLVVTRWILARLRNRTFFSLAELNEEIRALLTKLNDRPFRKMEGSRRSHFESMEKQALKPLPEQPFEFAEWKGALVNIDYHIDVTGHFYSVPYILKGQKVDVRYTAATVEVLHNGKRVASHVRSFLKGKYTTLKEHLPPSHREYLDWPPSRLVNWAKTIGPHAQKIVEAILTEPVYPVQGYRRCLGILRLGKQYGEERLEKACERALAIRSLSYQTVKSILKTGTDKRPLRRLQQEALPLDHDNIRGPRYFH